MRKLILPAAAFIFVSLSGVAVFAQSTDNKEEKKPETTTIDAWRGALPASEQPAYVPPPKSNDRLNNDADVEETPAEIEKRILDLEGSLMEAVKLRDSKTLRNLLSDDFVIAGINIPGAQNDKVRYINWAHSKLSLKSYTVERPTVHPFATAAVVTYNYKRQATIGDAPSDGDFTVTDVWVKRGNRWQAVSHHISPMPKP